MGLLLLAGAAHSCRRGWAVQVAWTLVLAVTLMGRGKGMEWDDEKKKETEANQESEPVLFLCSLHNHGPPRFTHPSTHHWFIHIHYVNAC